MRNGISAGPLPQINLPFGTVVEKASDDADFSPLVVYAIKVNESGDGTDPAVQSDDGGHGLMQLTASFPQNWADPYANVAYAIVNFLIPAENFWAGQGFSGDDLVRAIAAEYNAGRFQALAGHNAGDFDRYTTNAYAARALAHYTALRAGQSPFA